VPRPLLYLAPNRWDGPRQRTQHLAAGLARSRPVTFVEPAAFSLPGSLRRRMRGQSDTSIRARLRQVEGGLSVFSPAATLPGSLQLRAVNRIVHRLARASLRRLAPQLAPGDVDLIVGWPPALDLALGLAPRRLIYDCLDLFPAFEQGRRRRLLEVLEAELEREAWAVVTTSRELERRWQARHRHVLRIPNGVEVERFLATAAAPPLPPDVADLPRPRLGYIGTVGPWVDLPLLSALATARPDWTIVLVGPVEPGLTVRQRSSPLRWLGERPYTSLPAYLAAMDVLLIPFRVTDLTRAVNPIKLYEYCASGRPIVATPLDEVVATGDLCHLGAGPPGFVRAVEDALREAAAPDPARLAARQALARASAWDLRVGALADLLDRRDEPPPPPANRR
jgi:hypothetical protein